MGGPQSSTTGVLLERELGQRHMGGKSHEDTEKEALCKPRRGLLKETNPVNASVSEPPEL